MPNPTYKLIGSVTVGAGGAASMEFTSIPQTYSDLVLKVSNRNNASATIRNSNLRINNNSSNIYYQRVVDSSSGGNYATANSAADPTIYWSGLTNDTNSTAGAFSSIEIYFPDYTNTSYSKTISAQSVAENMATFGQIRFSGMIASTANAITSIQVIGENTFLQNSTAHLYGINNS
jgi:hypothetical protein